MYCITCGKEVTVVDDAYHTYDVRPIKYGVEWQICKGPFTQCPPPPILSKDDWDTVFANEPSPEEFELVEQEADFLQTLI